MLAVFEGIENRFEKLHTAAVVIYCNILLFRITNECVNSLDMLSQVINQYQLTLLHGSVGTSIRVDTHRLHWEINVRKGDGVKLLAGFVFIGNKILYLA